MKGLVMLIDGNDLPNTSALTADVCIVGAGPAGITLALELADAGTDVLLLESGGATRERVADHLRKGASVGYPMSVARTRARGLGGSSLAWSPTRSLRTRPLDAIDFERRDCLPYSGWPFDRPHLDPFYERAQVRSGMGPYRYDPEHWADPEAAPPLPLAGTEVETAIFQFGPYDQWRSHIDELARASCVRLVSHATVVDIETDGAPKEVSGLRVRGSGAAVNEFTVRARRYVLALGGLENARLLLASDRVHPRGVGNQHDLVGRFFMEHLSHDTGLLQLADPSVLGRLNLYRQRYMVRGTPIQGTLAVANGVLRREGLRNAMFWVQPSYELRSRPSVTSARTLLSAARRRPLIPGLSRHLANIVTDPVSVARVAYEERGGRHPAPSALRFRVLAEQAPNPDSRVTLSRRPDRLGMRQLQVDWRITPADIESICRHQEILGAALEASGIGVLTRKLSEERPAPTMIGNAHHMGTTRMHRDERLGVVDANSRVHGMRNLFVTGSSVFPTGGYSNPTLTIVALAVRLADHLRDGGGPGR